MQILEQSASWQINAGPNYFPGIGLAPASPMEDTVLCEGETLSKWLRLLLCDR